MNSQGYTPAAARRSPGPVIGLLLALLLLASCSKPPRFESLPPGSTVLAFGDSITFGTGADPGQDYPTRLAAISGWQVVNAGIPGDMARDAGKRLPAALEQHAPAMVIIELGGNDFLRKRSPKLVRTDLQAILQMVKDSGAVPVLVAVPRLSLLRASTGLLEDDDLYADLAAQEQVLLIDAVLSDILSDEELRADRIHPNARGYDQLARGLADRLRASGLL